MYVCMYVWLHACILSVSTTQFCRGQNWRRDGLTICMNKNERTVVIERDVLVEVRMNLIWENLCWHSLEEFGTVFKAFFNTTKFQGISSYLNNQGIHELTLLHLTAAPSPNVVSLFSRKVSATFSGQKFGPKILAKLMKSESPLLRSRSSMDIFNCL